MMLSLLWVLGMSASLLYSIPAGTAHLLTDALTAGIADAVTFCMGAGAMMVFWCGLFSVMEQAGLADALAHMLRPLLKGLFPISSQQEHILAALSANVSANLLGLGNAATPMGIQAARAMSALPHAAKELGCLVVLNTASVQLLPTTVAAIRSSLGCAAPMDILPCVLLTSLCSVAAGLAAAKLLQP